MKEGGTSMTVFSMNHHSTALSLLHPF